MKLRINTVKLEKLIRDFGGYLAVEDASKDVKGKRRISARTLYNLVEGQGWRNETINVVCEILRISPSEIVIVEGLSNGHTHASPQSVKGKKKQVAAEHN